MAWLGLTSCLTPTGLPCQFEPNRLQTKYPQISSVDVSQNLGPHATCYHHQYVGLHGFLKDGHWKVDGFMMPSRNTEAIHHEVTNKSSSVSSTPNLFSLWIVWFVKMRMLQTFRNRQDNKGKFAAYVHIELCMKCVKLHLCVATLLPRCCYPATLLYCYAFII